MIALIDCDLICWEIGSALTEEGPLPYDDVIRKTKGRIASIVYATQAASWQGYLTSEDKSNFRYEVATILPYKGSREGVVKPDNYYVVRDYLINSRGCQEISGMEADDALSIEQYQGEGGTIICSRDKDLDMVPGWHYGWGSGKQKEKGLYHIDEVQGMRNFYKQLMCGDNVDNIPGLYGVGDSGRYMRHLDKLDDTTLMREYVEYEYKVRFGSYWKQFFDENASLLWMLRSVDDIPHGSK